MAEVGTLRQYVNFLSKGVIGVSADGKFLWRYDRLGNNFANTYTPIVLGDLVFCASGYKSGYCLLQLIPERGGITVREIYTVQIPLQPWLSSLVSQGECVLLCTGGDGMIAVEFRTGKVLWRAGKTSRSDQDAMVFADSHAYLRNSAGRVLLAAITSNGLVTKGEFVPPRPGTTEPTWTFPVITGGRLYLRDQGLLLCYDLRDKVSRRRPDVIFVPTPQDVVEKMLELANVKKNDVVADLGCGDGRIVITAAKKYACKAVGYDLDDECVRLSLDQVKAARVEKLVRVEHKDIFDVDLTGVTVVAVYLGPTLNEKLIPQFKKMKPGSRIVSHAFEIPGIKPDRVAELTSEEDGVAHKIYGWTTPFPASVEARRARAHVGH